MINVDEKSIISMANEIFALAEPQMKEYQSCQVLVRYLKENGFDVELEVADMTTAFIASKGAGSPVIGLLAEYDALDGLSQKPLPWKEPIEEGAPGHGCGHNLLGAAACVAAVAVAQKVVVKNQSGTVKVFGTPGQELLIGKPAMARKGLFEGLDLALIWHPFYSMNTGRGALAYDSVKFIFLGESAFAGEPHLARSALDAAVLMEVIVNFLKEHMLPHEAMWNLSSVFVNAGKEPSVIPEKAEIWYSYGALERRFVDKIYEYLTRAAKGASIATGTEVNVRRITGCHHQIMNETVSKVMLEALKKVGPPNFTAEELEFARNIQQAYGIDKLEPLDVTIPDEPQFNLPKNADDRSEVSWFAPLACLTITCWPDGIPAHSWGTAAPCGMSIGHKAAVVAAKVLALTAMEFIDNPRLIVNAKDELNERTVKQGHVYEPLLDPNAQPYTG